MTMYLSSCTSSRLVFTSDGVIVRVVIRSIEWNDLEKIKPTESEAENWFCSTPSLTIKWKLHCRSRKAKRKNKPMTMFDSRPWDWLVLPLPTPTTYFSLDHKRRTRKRNRKKWKRSNSSDSDSVELMTPLTTPIFTRSLATPTTTLVKTSL